MHDFATEAALPTQIQSTKEKQKAQEYGQHAVIPLGLEGLPALANVAGISLPQARKLSE
jgi:hypothetical protein